LNQSSYFRYFIKLIIIGLFFFFTIEVCARIDDSIKFDAPFFKNYREDSLRSVEDGIPFNIPNARFEKWQNNSFGFRGPEFNPVKSNGITRIVCIGASESYGMYETPGMEWPAQLQNSLPRSEFQVINASVIGLNMSNFKQYITKRVQPLKPDIIVMLINPFFYAVSFERSTRTQPLATVSTVKNDNEKRFSLKNDFSLRIIPKAKQVLKQAVSNSFPALLKKYQLSSLQKQITSLELDRLSGRTPKNSVSEVALIKFRSDLHALVTSLKAQKVGVVLCSYPALIDRTNLQTYPEIFLDHRRFCIEYSLQGMIDVLGSFNSVIKDVADKEGIIFIDAHAKLPKNIYNFGDDVHYLDKGAGLLAEAVAQALRKWVAQ
jgi:lysophospholipase L1-like esterase